MTVTGGEPDTRAIQGAQSFILVRAAGAVRVVAGLEAQAAQLDEVESEANYWCNTPEECWRRCPEPELDGGSTSCSCERMDGGDDDEGQYWCTVTFHRPGEHPWEGGGGGGECGDARDGLADEYADRGIWGDWPCTKFSTDHSDLIGVGTSGYHSHHDGYGYVSSSLPAGIKRVKSHFNIELEYTSGYRCPEKNAAVSTSANPDGSHHIFGQAVDFSVSGWTAELKESIHIWGSNPENADESIKYPNHHHLAWR